MDKLILEDSKVFPGNHHKYLLLEMCKSLIGSCHWIDDSFILFLIDKNKSVEIHWLEVCILHLPKAMANPNNRKWDIAIRQVYHMHEFYHHPKHPIDDLYREYKDKSAWK